MIWGVVPAAGRGTRFGGDMPKQYLDVAGKPLIAHTLRALLAHRDGRGRDGRAGCGRCRTGPAGRAFAGKPVLTCIGGAARARFGACAALGALPDDVRADDFVLVHDAARPYLALDDLEQLLERGRNDPVGAILAAPVRDTLKRAGDDGGIDGTEPRERLWRALTPQLFRRLQLTRALEAAREAGVERHRRIDGDGAPGPAPAAGRGRGGQYQGHHAGRSGALRIHAVADVSRSERAMGATRASPEPSCAP